jgi:RNA polymerase sigma factor (sigma-70 family)
MKTKQSVMMPYNQECDEIIWVEFRKGNRDAFSVLYHRYFKILCRSGVRLSNDEDLVKDCIHDLFMEIWSNKINMIVPDSIRAYLITCLQRKIIRHLKKRPLWQGETDRVPDVEFVHSREEQMITEQRKHDQVKSVTLALNSLTKRQKEAVCLKFYSDLSYPEIADMMSISTDSTYNLVSKAICNLHHALTKKVSYGMF